MLIRKIAIISPYARSIPAFKGHLIRKLVGHGIHVVVLAPDYSPELRKEVQFLGAVPIDYALERTGMNPLKEIGVIISLVQILNEVRPDAVFGYNHKPVLYSLLAGRLAKIPLRYGMLEGLGFAFTQSDDFVMKRRLIRFVLWILYRIALPYASKIFFLNKDDLSDFQRLGLIKADQAVVLGGIGVDLHEWASLPPKTQPVTFTLSGRLLRDKGVIEFMAAALLVKSKYSGIRFFLLGGVDSNPGAIPLKLVRKWVDDGTLEWPGHINNMKKYLAETSVFVLPSYREGVPRSTQEAMASARPIISTDVPGCRETVQDGINGFLVSPRDHEALAEAMERFVLDPGLIERMGSESRKMAEERFDVEKINARLIEELLS